MIRVDEHFSNLQLAEFYDAWHPPAERDDYAFYLELLAAAPRVLDVGCGTGSLLGLARNAGHTGRLAGVDPAPGMLAVARRRSDIEWFAGDIGAVPTGQSFDLAVMTGHAFQALVEDDEIRALFDGVRSRLAPGGRFAFETRNPGARTWERWIPENAVEVPAPGGGVLRMEHHVSLPVVGETVHFQTRYTGPGWDGSLFSESTLRFLPQEKLNRMLGDAGFAIEEQYGHFDWSPLHETSPEIITIARPR